MADTDPPRLPPPDAVPELAPPAEPRLLPPPGGGTAPEGRWFGFREVDPREKATLVRNVFDRVARRYDLMNDLMSGGVHRLWKAELVRRVHPRPGMTMLDVAGGTGDVAFRLLDAAAAGLGWAGAEAPPADVVVCDINHSMLSVGRDRAVDANRLSGLTWVCGDAQHLPLPDSCVDVYTIAFGLRNVTDIDLALREARRVLKPGGRFFCLEFSHVRVPGLREAYDLYSFEVLPRLGRVVAGDRESYQYLVESIRRFPDQPSLARRMEAAGLERARWVDLTGGVAAIHMGWRL